MQAQIRKGKMQHANFLSLIVWHIENLGAQAHRKKKQGDSFFQRMDPKLLLSPPQIK